MNEYLRFLKGATREAIGGNEFPDVRARVEIVAGQGLGQIIEQRTPCGAWDHDGGFEFRELTPNVAMTLRASAPGSLR